MHTSKNITKKHGILKCDISLLVRALDHAKLIHAHRLKLTRLSNKDVLMCLGIDSDRSMVTKILYDTDRSKKKLHSILSFIESADATLLPQSVKDYMNNAGLEFDSDVVNKTIQKNIQAHVH